jgi:DNA-directed RNA polymerase subunit RPC12/RpoP
MEIIDADKVRAGEDLLTIDDIEGVRLVCPNCGSHNNSVNGQNPDAEWIYINYNCMECGNTYTGSFRLVDVENTERFLD